ncbi:MAG: helix-hairpin-helix domain-containing protein [Thermoplasmata archaeon]|nr:MAG: helix-hairpin-helix domain-containing protein [Thermoplasmata archaeon]
MEFTKMHLFLIVCLAAIVAVIISLVTVWACSLAAFISIIALTFVLNDYLEERKLKRAHLGTYEDEAGFDRPLDESYPEWGRKEKLPTAPEPEVVMAKPLPQNRMIVNYMRLFELDEVRATNLYDAGYRNITKIRRAELEDLIKIKGINPTMAKRIKRATVIK